MRKGTILLIGNLWKYILVAVVSIFIWSAVFTSIGQIKDNQRLTISVYNLDLDTQALKDEVAAKLPELSQQEILELYVDDMEHIPNQTYANDLLTMQLLQTDLIIMPESLLKELKTEAYFPEIPESLQRNSDYQIGGKHYGILLNRYSQKEPVYLLLASNSVNLGGILDRGNPEDDAALVVLQYLVKEDGK